MNDCAESVSRVCKAYIADCYGHLANSFNTCRGAERQILKRKVFGMLDRVKSLLDNEIPKETTGSVDETNSPID